MAKLSTNAAIERDDGTRIEPATAVYSKLWIDLSYEIYLGRYQALTGPEERQTLFREFSPAFFDLIVIDECHRTSAAEALLSALKRLESCPPGYLAYVEGRYGKVSIP